LAIFQHFPDAVRRPGDYSDAMTLFPHSVKLTPVITELRRFSC